MDDSVVVRRLLSEALAGEAGIEVVGTAPDPFVARDMILALSPDVLTLDIEMPGMNGLSFLKRLMHYHPLPVIVISSLGQTGCGASVEALRLGAMDVLAKPAGPYSVGDLTANLAGKIRDAASARPRRGGRREASSPDEAALSPLVSSANPNATRHLVAIGASTGGTQAIEQVLEGFAADCPPVVIAQHIPAGFSRTFAERLNQLLPMVVKEAENGDLALPGRVLIAPGGFHMLVEKRAGGYGVLVKEGPLVCYQRPSVDVLFGSVAQAAGPDAVAAILTGMGSDGANGAKRIRDRGGWTIAQDEASCVVYGMPREAVKAGGVEESVSLAKTAWAIGRGLCRPVELPTTALT